MSNFTPAKPGDLITANYFNQIFASFDSRISALEGATISTGAAVITGISPSGPVQVGQPLTVTGRNFGFSIGAQQVFIDTVQVNAFQAGSSDQQLVFIIPTSISNVPAQGRSAILSISNGIPPAATQTISLLPGFTLAGGVDVNYVGPSTTGAVVAGSPYVLQFTLNSRANLDATYAVQPLVTGPPNAAAFNNNLQVLDASQNVIPSGSIQLFAGQQVTFYVSINPVPAGSTGAFSLTVNASAGAVSGSSGAQSLTVGAASPVPDTTITANYSSSAILPAGGGTVTASQIQLAPGAQAKVTILVVFTVAASYNVTVVQTSGSGWSASLFAQTTVTPQVIQASDLSNPTSSASRYLDFLIAPGANASSTGTLQFNIQNAGLTTMRSYPMSLVLS